MSQPRRIIERLITQDRLPIEQVDTAAIQLEIYPSGRSWFAFFDRALLIISAVALVLSLVFFIAYNWQNLGKMGKFALAEAALVITITLYVALSFRRRFRLIRQLLLFIASVITGSLLALFGQVYQTGADTWQLFFAWSILIIPWVLIARFPALWLLWLGLVNACLILYLDIIDLSFVAHSYQSVIQVTILALVNLVALNLWLIFTDNEPDSTNNLSKKSSLHWSTYIVGLLSTYFSSHLAIVTVFEDGNLLATLISISLWASWCVFMWWRFYWRQIDLLMLTYLCFSSIVVIMFWVNKLLLSDSWEAASFLILALLLITLSSAAIIWLRKVAQVTSDNYEIKVSSGGAENE